MDFLNYLIMENINGLKRNVKRQFYVTVCLNIGHFMVGYSVAWTAPIIPKLQDPAQSQLQEPISLSEASLIRSDFSIGAIIGNEEDAIKTLNYFGRTKEAYNELKSLNEDSANNRSNCWGWKEMLTVTANRKSFMITVSMYIVQECCGIISMSYYSTAIFQEARFSIDPSTSTIILGFIQLLSTLIALIFVEFVGRKILLLISTAGCGLCTATLGLYFNIDFLDLSLVSSLDRLPLVLLASCYYSYGIGLNTVPNTLLGEMYSTNMRSFGTSVSMTLARVFGYIFLANFVYIVKALGAYFVFWIHAVINILGFILVALIVPETKSMTLREIEIMLSK